MPELARFYGIVIAIFYDEKHHNAPHIHAAYGEYKVSIGISDRRVLVGRMPKSQLQLVFAWMIIHEAAIAHAWAAVSHGRSPRKIAPLR